MKFNNKQIITFGVLGFIIIFLGILAIYMFIEPEGIPEGTGEIVTSQNEIIRNPERDEYEEELVVDEIIGDAIVGDLSNYRDPVSVTDERKVLTEESYKQYYDEIIRFVGGRNLDAAQNLADLVYSEYEIENPDWMEFFVTTTMLSDFEGDEWSQQTYMDMVWDPQLYVLLFTMLDIPAQGAYLPRLNMEVLPDGTNQNCFVEAIETNSGTYYSEAYRYFSDYENTNITKITVMYDSHSKFDVYFAYNKESGTKLITNIVNADPSVYASSTYEEYFEFSGLEPDKFEYD
mgnify:CR=1 FL=1